jgi:predicted phage tail protein
MSEQLKRISGAGGGKGSSDSGTARAPVEAPDSLQSRSVAKVLDLLGEGEMEGLVDGLRSIYLNETPLQDAEGNSNFQDVSVTVRLGTQDQEYIPGFETQEAETAVSAEVKASTPIVRQITDEEVNAVRVTVGVPGLASQDVNNGDLNGTSVEIAIDVQPDGGSYTAQAIGANGATTDVISGKTRSRYQRSYMITLTGAAPWNIRVRRITADSTQASLNNKTFWDAYTEIIDAKLTYPNSAVVGLGINAAQFPAIPTRAYHMKLLRVRVPSNYNPVTRAYTGTWDGTFQIAHTDNPAWCFYDLLTQERYGLGSYIPEELTDKWTLYTIGRYCDELVPDGKGGTEPRFTLNVYLQAREAAYKVINDLASVFRGMVYWASGSVYAVQDSPSDPTAVFTAANVVNGEFTREGSSRKARHTVVLVTWNDPNNFSRPAVEYVEDAAGILRYGIRPTEVVAFGCTSQGQAHRVGKWLLYTELNESEVVTWRTGLDASYLRPGMIAKIMDPARTAIRAGGRLRAATSNSVTLDAPFVIQTAVVYTLTVVMPDGSLVDRVLTNAPGSMTVATFATALPSTDIVQAVWVIGSPTLEAELVRVLAVSEESPTTYMVAGLTHIPGKFDAIEENISLQVPETSNLRQQAAAILPPTNIVFNERLIVDPTGQRKHLDLSWTPPATALVVGYVVEYRAAGGNWLRATNIRTADYRIPDVGIGVYEVRVFSVSILGNLSVQSLDDQYEVENGTGLPPARVTGLEILGQGNDTVFTGKDVTVVWRVNSPGGSYDLGAEPFGGNSGYVDPYFKCYDVRVYDEAGELIHTEPPVLVPRYTFTYQKNFDAGLHRTFTIGVTVRDTYNRTSREARLRVTNPQVGALNEVDIRPTFRQIFMEYEPAAEVDWAGVMVWVSQTDGFTPDEDNPTYNGSDTLIVLDAAPGTTYYLRYAGYDTFGVDDLQMSGQTTITIPMISAGDLAAGSVVASHLHAALGSRIDLIDAPTTGLVTQVATEITTRAAADTALAASITSLTAVVSGNYSTLSAAITTEATTRADADTAISTTVSTLSSTVATNYTTLNSAIGSEATTRANADSALSTSITTLQSTVTTLDTTLTAALATEATTRATADGGLLAQYTVKIDLDGYVSGYGLASTLVNDTPFSEFLVRADRFAIGSPGASDVVPFIVDTGVVYINTAHIKNASIVSAMIDTLDASKITTTSLSAISANLGTITAGTITLNTSGYIRGGQTDYNTGTGFFLGYHGAAYKFSIGNPAGHHMAWDGTSLTLRGTLNGADITANTIAATSLVTGSVTATQMAVGTITAASGILANLSVGTANIADANITTLKVAGNAITTPLSAFTAANVAVSNTGTVIQSVTITTTGGSVFIIGSYSHYNTSGITQTGVAQINRGGTLLTNNLYTAQTGEDYCLAVSVMDTPAAGTYQYDLISNGVDGNAGTRSLMIMEVKR